MATATPNSVTIPVVNGGNGTLDDEFINGLVQGGSWVFSGPRNLTYSFNLNDNGAYPEFPELLGPGPGGTWAASPQVAVAVAQALDAWKAVANVNFQEVTSGNYYFESTGDLSFTLTGNDLQNGFGASALGFFPDPAYVDTFLDGSGYTTAQFPNMEGNVFLDNYGTPLASSVTIGSQGFWTILHEIGHALGLKHTFDDGGNLKQTFAQLGLSAYDAMQYTVMSYTASNFKYAATPMPLDILAIQTIYGANTSYNTGNNTYTLNDHGYYGTIWDAGGIDTIDATALSTFGVLIDLNAGSYSGEVTWDKTTAIAYNVTIENAIGSLGQDSLFGNSAANNLTGADGNDTLDGASGADTMLGGSGNDFYVIDNMADVLVESSGDGFDSARSSVTYALAQHVEDLALTGAASIDGTGNASANLIAGNSGNNRLAGLQGLDILEGGGGNDVYELADAATSTHVLFAGMNGLNLAPEKTRLFDSTVTTISATASDGGDLDSLVDTISIGFIFGGAFYGVELHASESSPLAPGNFLTPGDSTSGTMFAGQTGGFITKFTVLNAEFDYATFPVTVLSFSATFQTAIGETLGVSGHVSFNDSTALIPADVVLELPDNGLDTLRIAVDGSLFLNVEKLIQTGSANIHGSGNALNNILSGNSGNNVLDGAGGSDIIAGGPGNDTYVIDSSGDQVMELGNSGTDLIQSGVTYNLMQSWHVENLTLTGGESVNGSGNWLNNLIIGNGASNVMDGDRGNDTVNGGGGSDTLIGGMGDDVLVWDALDASVRGGEGTDMLRVDGSGVTLDLTSIANTLITDMEVINITGSGNNTLTLALADVLTVSSSTDVLRIDGNAGDVVNAGGGWVSGGSQVIGLQSYNAFTQGTSILLVDADITLNLA